uniref:G_PROTEIN_RECEP_F1_2 domain-containing protein n=1 Tax=Panagrellus redivivus TaxID=6233 RepID=A0A7E4W248_PANRE
MNLSTYDPSLGHVYPLYLSITTMIACVLGIMFNSLIIIVIVKTKSLHNRCYLLIAYLAAADLVCSVYYTALRILIFNYVYFMTNYDCFVFSFVGLVAMNTQTGLTVMLGIDRLFAVSLPTKYRTIKSKYYIFLLILPVNLFAFGITGYGYADASRDVKVPVCFPPNAYNASARQVWTIANCFIIAIVLILYIAVHYKFKQSQISNNDATIKVASKVIRAIYAVILVFIGTWAFTYVVMALTTPARQPQLKSDVTSPCQLSDPGGGGRGTRIPIVHVRFWDELKVDSHANQSPKIPTQLPSMPYLWVLISAVKVDSAPGNMSQDEKKPVPPPDSGHNSATGSSGSSSGSSTNPPSTPSSNDAIADFGAAVSARLTEAKEKLIYVCSGVYDCVVGNDMAVHTRKMHMWPMDPTKYQIRSCIGRGGVGDVFLAINIETMAQCVLKTITINADNSQQLIDELRILNKLRNAHIIRMNSAFLTDDVLCIVMPFMYSLRRVAHVHITRKPPLTPAFENAQITEILYQVLQGLSFMHEKHFIHRDLKCDNILINEEGCVKIGDLGLAKMIRRGFNSDNSKWEKSMQPMGTAGFMAPEVVEHLFGKPGIPPYHFSCDIWSLGMCVVEMVLADNPFYNMDDDAIQKAVMEWPKFRIRLLHPEGAVMEGKCSRDVLNLISLCLEKDPKERPLAAWLLTSHPLFQAKNKADFEFVARSIVPNDVTTEVRQMEYVDAERDEKLKKLKLSYCVAKVPQDQASGPQTESYSMPIPTTSLYYFDPSLGKNKGFLIRLILRHKVKDYLLSRDIPLGLDLPQRTLETVLRQSFSDWVQCEAMDSEDFLKTCREGVIFLLDLTMRPETCATRRYVQYSGVFIPDRLQRCCLMEFIRPVYSDDFSIVGNYFMHHSLNQKRFENLDISMNNSA